MSKDEQILLIAMCKVIKKEMGIKEISVFIHFCGFPLLLDPLQRGEIVYGLGRKMAHQFVIENVYGVNGSHPPFVSGRLTSLGSLHFLRLVSP